MRDIKIVNNRHPYYGRKYTLSIRWDKNHSESTDLSEDELKYLAKLVKEKFTSDNTERDEMCHCEHGGAWRELPNIIHCTPVNYCGNCGGKLSPVS